jgi:DNA-binding transcriptional LysR family regulator
MSHPAPSELDPETFVLRRLSLRQLRMLVALDKEGSLSAAAERLHITQPAVSKTLAELERGLGQTLFARRGRNVHSTAVGQRLVALAHRLEEDLQRGATDIAALQREGAQKLAVGATNAALSQLLPRAISAFKAELPEAALSVRTHALSEMLEDLRKHKLDIVVARMPENARPQGLRAHGLGPARQVVAMSTVHPLLRSRQLTWEVLAQQAWVWPLLGTHTRTLQDRLWQRLALAPPRNRVEVGDMGLVAALFKHMPLLALMPHDSAQAAALAGFAKILPLEAPLGLTDLVAWHLPTATHAVAKRFLHHLKAAAAAQP